MAKTPAWQRAEGKNPEGGLNEKGRASLRAEGHDIKRPQPEGGSRRDSFCARMKGMKSKLTSSETANDPDSRINKSLRKWNCADGGAVDPYDSVQQAAIGNWAKEEASKPSPLKGLMDIGTVGATYGLEKARERMDEPFEPALQIVKQSVVEPAKSAYHIAAQSTGEEPYDPYTAVQHASNVAGAMTLGAGAFDSPVGSIRSGVTNPLYHGSPIKGLTELRASERGPLGPGIYTSEAPQVAEHYTHGEGQVYQVPHEKLDIYRGHGHRSDEEWFGYQDDRRRLIDAVPEEHKSKIIPIIEKMWSGDGYPLYQRIRGVLGSDEAAQNLFKKAGFHGISGLIDGPETLIFSKKHPISRAKGGPIWDKPRPKKLGKPEPLSPKEKASAKAAAKAAGRPYPNLIDNMRAARADGGQVEGDVQFADDDPYAKVQRASMGDWAREEAAQPSPLKGLMDIGTVGATYGLEKARERIENPFEPASQLVQQSVVEPAKSAYHIAAQSTGEEPFDPYTAVQHASNVAGALTLGAGAFERPAGSLAMGASRVKDPFPYFGGAEIPGGYGSIASPFHPDPALRAEALKMSQKYITPVEGRYVGQPGSYYSTAQSAHPLDVSPTIIGTPKSVGKGDIILKPTNEMTWEQFAKQGKGGTLINLAGDRMNFGRLTHINDQPLAWPVDIQAGPKYMREPNPNEVWANDPNAATGIRKAIASASERGPVYGVYTPMGAQAVNSSHNMFEAIMAQIPGSGISKADMEDFDAAIKSGKQVIGNTPKIVAKRKNAIELMKNWPGIANAKEASEFAKTLPGVHRTDIINMIEKGSWRDKGFPNVGMTRVALTDPQFLRAPNNMMGGRMVELSPERTTTKPKQFTHVSYPIETYGKYLADVPLVQRQYVMPEVMKRYVKPTATGTVVHPYSLQDMGRNSFRKVFETNVHQQPINQEFLDSVMLGLERQKEYGFKKGGEVSQRDKSADPLRAAVVYPHSKPKASR